MAFGKPGNGGAKQKSRKTIPLKQLAAERDAKKAAQEKRKAEKAEAKKLEAKKAAPKKAAPAKKEPAKKVDTKKAAPEKDSKRVYHLSKREDGKWAVRFAGGEKVIKLFDTQKEGLEYCNKMAENQGGVVLVHNSKGKNKGRIQ